MPVKDEREWKVHYMIGLPTVPIRNWRTRVTERQVNEAKKRLAAYKKKHQLRRR